MDSLNLVPRYGADEGAAVARPSTADILTYFFLPEFSYWMMAHIAIMTVTWVFILPIAVMLSLARAKLPTLGAQFIFIAANAIGLLCGTVYNSRTPDLYPKNAHHKLGWIVTWILIAQAVIGLLRVYAPDKGRNAPRPEEDKSSKPALPGHYQRASGSSSHFSGDSGYGVELTESPLSSPSSERETHQLEGGRTEPTPADADDEEEKDGLLGKHNKVDRYFARKLRGVGTGRVMRLLGLACDVVDRTSLVLGFIVLATGGLTYGGFAQGTMVLTVLAHFIKGGIFLWYGFFTLGRFLGAFAEFGWAWNVRPARRSGRNVPSAEFFESFVIFLYGSVDVFLERLHATTSEWSSQDLEHVSIAVMFFGGGLCGMLLESRRIRALLNSTIRGAPPRAPEFRAPYDGWQEPKVYRFSMNPLPAIIILLLGIMMSSHHQTSMNATMLHGQWGRLLAAGGFFRGLTYVLTYLKPPQSHLPSRPPTEVVTAFCMIAGGFLFMGSNGDFVATLDARGVDAMFLFNLTMGLTAFLMAWEMAVLALRSWAGRRAAGTF